MNKTKKNILWVFLFLFFFNFLFFYSGGNLINVQYRSDLNSMVAGGKRSKEEDTKRKFKLRLRQLKVLVSKLIMQVHCIY